MAPPRSVACTRTCAHARAPGVDCGTFVSLFFSGGAFFLAEREALPFSADEDWRTGWLCGCCLLTPQSVVESKVTTLPNKVRVASEALPGHFHALGVYIDAGSRYESSLTSGCSHLLDRLAFKVRRREERVSLLTIRAPTSTRTRR